MNTAKDAALPPAPAPTPATATTGAGSAAPTQNAGTEIGDTTTRAAIVVGIRGEGERVLTRDPRGDDLDG